MVADVNRTAKPTLRDISCPTMGDLWLPCGTPNMVVLQQAQGTGNCPVPTAAQNALRFLGVPDTHCPVYCSTADFHVPLPWRLT